MANTIESGAARAEGPLISPANEALLKEIVSLELQARLIARSAFPYEEYHDVLRRAYTLRRMRLFTLVLGVVTALTLVALVVTFSFQLAHLADISFASMTLAQLIAAGSFIIAFGVFLVLTMLAMLQGAYARTYSACRRIVSLDREVRRCLRRVKEEDRLASETYIRQGVYQGLRDDALAQTTLGNTNSHDALVHQIRTRLREAIESNARSGRFHLIVGMALAFIGIAFVVIVGQEAMHEIPDGAVLGQRFWTFLIARVSPALGVQALWLFFFWSYRRAEAEAKFFQNELTTMESKALALRLANDSVVLEPNIALSDKQMKVLTSLISQLLANERHLILKRGEHTMYTRQLEIDGRGFGDLLRALRGGPRSQRAAPS